MALNGTIWQDNLVIKPAQAVFAGFVASVVLYTDAKGRRCVVLEKKLFKLLEIRFTKQSKTKTS